MRIVKQPPLCHRDISISGRGLRPIVRRIARHNRLYDDIRERYRQRLDDDYEPVALTFRDERDEGQAELLGGVYTLNILNRYVASTALTVTNQVIFERLAEIFHVYSEAAGVYLPRERAQLERCFDRVVERKHLLELADALDRLSDAESHVPNVADGRMTVRGGAAPDAPAVPLGARDLSRLVSLMVSDGQLRQVAEESGVLGELQELLGAMRDEHVGADETVSGTVPAPVGKADRPVDGAAAFLQWLVEDAAQRLAAFVEPAMARGTGDGEGERGLDTALTEALAAALQIAGGEEPSARAAAGEAAKAPACLETARLVMARTDRALKEELQREVMVRVRMLSEGSDSSPEEPTMSAATGERAASDARSGTVRLGVSDLRERIIELVGDIDAAEVASLHERGILPAADGKAVVAAIENIDDESALRELAQQVIDVRRHDYLEALVDLYRSEASSLEAVLFSADEALFERLQRESTGDAPLAQALRAVAAAADGADTAPLREAARAVLADAAAGERDQTRNDMTRLVSSFSTVLNGALDMRLEHLVRSDAARKLVTQLHTAIDRTIAEGGAFAGATLNGQVLPFLEVLREAQQGFDDMTHQIRGAEPGGAQPMDDAVPTVTVAIAHGMDDAAADYLARNRAVFERTGLPLPVLYPSRRADRQALTLHEARERIVAYLQTLEGPELDRLVDAGVLPTGGRTELVEQIMSSDSSLELRVLGERIVAAREAVLVREMAELYRAQAKRLAQDLGADDAQRVDAALVALAGNASFGEAVSDIARIMDADERESDFAASVELAFNGAATVTPAERHQTTERLVRSLVARLADGDSPVAERLVRSKETQTVIDCLRSALDSALDIASTHGPAAGDSGAQDAVERSEAARMEAVRREAQDLEALATSVGSEVALRPAFDAAAAQAVQTARERIVSYLRTLDADELDGLVAAGVLPRSNQTSVMTMVASMTDEDELRALGERIVEVRSAELVHAAAQLYRADAEELAQELFSIQPQQADAVLSALDRDEAFAAAARETVRMLGGAEDAAQLSDSVKLVLAPGAVADTAERRRSVERLVRIVESRLADADDPVAAQLVRGGAAETVLAHLRDALASASPGASVPVGAPTDTAVARERRALAEAMRHEAQELAELAYAVEARGLSPVPADLHERETAETAVPALQPAQLVDRGRMPQAEVWVAEHQGAPAAPTAATVTRILERLTHAMGAVDGIAAVRRAIDREAAALEGDVRQQLIVALDDTFAAKGAARTAVEEGGAAAQQLPTSTSVYLTLLDLFSGDGSQSTVAAAAPARTLGLARVLAALRPQRFAHAAQAAPADRAGVRQTAREQAAPYRTIETARDELVLADAAARAGADAPQAPIARAMNDMERRITTLTNNAMSAERASREFEEQLAQSVTSLRTSLEHQDAQIADLKRQGDELAARTSREVVTDYVFREFERKAVIERMRRGR